MKTAPRATSPAKIVPMMLNAPRAAAAREDCQKAVFTAKFDRQEFNDVSVTVHPFPRVKPTHWLAIVWNANDLLSRPMADCIGGGAILEAREIGAATVEAVGVLAELAPMFFSLPVLP